MPWSQPIRAQYLEGSGPIRGLHSHPRATCTVSLLATAQSGWPRQAPALSASTATSTPSSRWSASGRWRLAWRRPDCRPSCSSSLWVTAPLMLVSRDSSTSPSFRSPWSRGSAPGLTFTSSPGRRMRWESDISGAAVASNLIISGQFTPHTSHLTTSSSWNLKNLAFHLYLTPFQISHLKSHTSNLTPQISYLKSRTSNLIPQISHLKPMTSDHWAVVPRAVAEALSSERGRLPAGSEKHLAWAGGLELHTKPWVRARAGREYWERMRPAGGRPFSAAMSSPDNWNWGTEGTERQSHLTVSLYWEQINHN